MIAFSKTDHKQNLFLISIEGIVSQNKNHEISNGIRKMPIVVLRYESVGYNQVAVTYSECRPSCEV